MDLKNIRSELHKLTALVEGWETLEQIPALERDLALEKLRGLYEDLRFGVAEQALLPTPMAASEEQAVTLDIDLGEVLSLDLEADVAPMSVAEPESEMPQVESDADVLPEPEFAPEPSPEPELVPEPELEPEFLPEPEPESAPEPSLEPAPAPKPVEVPPTPTLFGEEDETLRHRHKQRVIMSLYDTTPAASRPAAEPALKPAAEPTPKPAVEPAPKPAVVSFEKPLGSTIPAPEPEMPEPEMPQPAAPRSAPEPIEVIEDDEPEIEEITVITTGSVLGDVINHDVQTLADTLAAPRSVASELRHSERIEDLHRAIGINDKFLLIRDLFGGDGDAFEEAIRALNEAESLDDCMIYIAENYAWNPNSDGAKLVMELLERKFS